MTPEKSPLQQFVAQLPCIQYAQKGQGAKEGAKAPEILPNFIVMEGADGAGNSTQARLLEQRLQQRGIPCQRSTEPTGGCIGKHIRSILARAPESATERSERNKLAEYFAADRAEHIWGLGGVEEQANSDVLCISERYLFSSLVYQSLDSDCPQGLEEIWDLNKDFPLPEYFFYLDIPSAVAEQRIAKREQREIFEREAFLEQVRQAYQALIAHLRQLNTGMQIHILDACRPQEELQDMIYSTVQTSPQNSDLPKQIQQIEQTIKVARHAQN